MKTKEAIKIAETKERKRKTEGHCTYVPLPSHC
jgi:hypothetical protein